MTHPRLAIAAAAALLVACSRPVPVIEHATAPDAEADDDEPAPVEEWKRSFVMVPFCYSEDPVICQGVPTWDWYPRAPGPRDTSSAKWIPYDPMLILVGRGESCPSGMHVLPPWTAVCIGDKYTLDQVEVEAAVQAVGARCRNGTYFCEGI